MAEFMRVAEAARLLGVSNRRTLPPPYSRSGPSRHILGRKLYQSGLGPTAHCSPEARPQFGLPLSRNLFINFFPENS